MANLPRDRLIPGKPPFSYVGINFFGPLYVKKGKDTAKHHGCLSSCLSMRAVNNEGAKSLERDSFFKALRLRRFISQRNTEDDKKPRGNQLEWRREKEREIRLAINNWNQQRIDSFKHLGPVSRRSRKVFASGKP